MELYKNGKIFEIMDFFENKVIPTLPGYSLRMDREQMTTIQLEDGRTRKRFYKNNYYQHGEVNKMFIAFLSGYSLGLLDSRLED